MVNLLKKSKVVQFSVIKGVACFLVFMSSCSFANTQVSDTNDPFTGDGFVNQDWQVVCDNTLTCRAVGYIDKRQIDMPASILFVAKPRQPTLKAYIKLASNIQEHRINELLGSKKAVLWLNNKDYGAIDSNNILSPHQIEALLTLARRNTKIEIKIGDKVWQISDKGMASVLLKLDEVQGRVGTSLALVSKNNPNRQTPKAFRPAPIVYRPTLSITPLTASKKRYFEDNIVHWIKASWSPTHTETIENDCFLIDPSQDEKEFMEARHSSINDWSFTALDANHTLASHVCWMGMPDSGHGYWVIDHNNPTKPKLVTLSASDYQEGRVWISRETRADCWSHKSWAWDGQAFVKASESGTGLCRGFLGGAWDLPTYITQSVNDNADVIETPLRLEYY